jgi:hypothetical protein
VQLVHKRSQETTAQNIQRPLLRFESMRKVLLDATLRAPAPLHAAFESAVFAEQDWREPVRAGEFLQLERPRSTPLVIMG